LSSDLCLKLVSLKSSLMDDFVTRSTDDQCLAAAGGHPLDPGWFLTLAWPVQIRQFANVVDLAGPLYAAQLAFLGQQTLHHIAPTADHLLGLVVEDGVFLPAEFDAPEAGYQSLLLPTTFDGHLQHLLGAVWKLHGLLVLPIDPVDGGTKLVRQRLHQRKFDD